jgi:acetolactate synthase-1/2/3 large subunit
MRLGALGTVGAGLPLALGACAGRPERRVVLFIGDGGMGFHLAELHTAARHNLDLTVIVGNDEGWGMEREIQAALYGAAAVSGCELGPARYDEAARALGARGERVERAADLRPALERHLRGRGPSLLDVRLRKGSVSPLTAASIAAKRA